MVVGRAEILEDIHSSKEPWTRYIGKFEAGPWSD